jgi:hypothetical protein
MPLSYHDASAPGPGARKRLAARCAHSRHRSGRSHTLVSGASSTRMPPSATAPCEPSLRRRVLASHRPGARGVAEIHLGRTHSIPVGLRARPEAQRRQTSGGMPVHARSGALDLQPRLAYGHSRRLQKGRNMKAGTGVLRILLHGTRGASADVGRANRVVAELPGSLWRRLRRAR